MSYPQSSLNSGLDDTRRRLLVDLEAAQQPSQYARGALQAISLADLTPDERTRVHALKKKWGTRW